MPAVPAKEVVIAYVGPLTPVSADAKARYPELKDYPVMELALEKTEAKGVRYATLYRLPGGYLGFANTRVMNARVEHSNANLTILRSTTPLPRGQYALACGDNSYEVRIE